MRATAAALEKLAPSQGKLLAEQEAGYANIDRLMKTLALNKKKLGAGWPEAAFCCAGAGGAGGGGGGGGDTLRMLLEYREVGLASALPCSLRILLVASLPTAPLHLRPACKAVSGSETLRVSLPLTRRTPPAGAGRLLGPLCECAGRRRH